MRVLCVALVCFTTLLHTQCCFSYTQLCVRICLAVARPGAGDAILVFVSGMAEIDALVELFVSRAKWGVK